MHIINTMQRDQPGNGELSGDEPIGNKESMEDARISRALTNDTIEGQLYPASRVPLILLQRMHLVLA